jgi:uncharacterized protein YhaN
VKLVRAKIFGFGKWVDQDFEINSDYQVIYGNNEAGKTTFLTFIKSILFGFASARGASKYEQYRPKNGANYGGELIFHDENDNDWTVRRIDGKGDGELSIFRNDQQVPNKLLSEITKGFDKSDFEATHVLNDETIRTVYELNENGLETEILALGAAGSKQWLNTADELEKDSGELYKPRGVKQPLINSINQYQELLAQKSEFENQQQQYLTVSRQLDEVKQSIDQVNQQYSKQLEQQKYFKSLTDSLPKYRELQELRKLGTDDQQLITTEDWEEYLKLHQQIETMQNSQHSMTSQITTDEEAFMDNYYSNQADIDYIQNRKNDIQNLIFQNDQLQEQLRKSDFETDQLMSNNPLLSDHMSLMNSDEIDQLNKPNEKFSVGMGIGIAVVALLLIFFVPNMIKIILGIIIIASGGWSAYQYKLKSDSETSQREVVAEILQRHQFIGLTPEQALALQPKIELLGQQRRQQHQLDSQITRSENELDKWRQLFFKVGILDQQADKHVFITEIEKFYNTLNRIKTKQSMIDQDQRQQTQVLNKSNLTLNELNEQFTQLLNKYQVSQPSQLVEKHERQISEHEQVNRLHSLEEILGSNLSILDNTDDISKVPEYLEQTNSALTECSTKQDQLLTQKGYLESQMKQLYDDSSYQKLIEDIEQSKSDMLEQYDEWLADKLASKWIHQMLDQASENRFPKMIERAKDYFTTLTNGNYIDISMNKDNQLYLTRQDKVKFDVHELSKATTVQLYISLRLAFVVEIGNIVDLPILIDDAFVDFDQERTSNVFEMIRQVAKDNQIIYVTANLNESIPESHVLRIGGQ